MFAIPHNFVEDFFIVRAVAASLTAHGIRAGEVRRWAVLGYGWCVLQIVSLFPGTAGYAAGAASPKTSVHDVERARALRPVKARVTTVSARWVSS